MGGWIGLAAEIILNGGQPDPIDWELKRRADDQKIRRDLKELRCVTHGTPEKGETT